ncbi:putative protein W [Talaromyces atroroseus]|uniref:Mannosyl-oligosaccharide glucosidase n=1 Tax=Talaromyces atroroseus TaxID=1441469 RepID=A0A225B9F3_TALAT|nr:putative protein W [Talaromyces atroroseus]OKL62587.1 putative protein W [Talaromyces atroroseus]
MVVVNDVEYLCEEEKRLQEDRARKRYWKKWGPYVAERQWATGASYIYAPHKIVDDAITATGLLVLREDYSENGDAWSHFSHDHARSRAYRWGEDGIAGVCDTHGQLNIAFSFWNEKESHSYMKYLYKYPQKKFPYQDLLDENARRGKQDREYQLLDTGVFKENRYWDIFIETAKEADDEEELSFRVIAYNRGPEPAPLHIIPHVWFRNTWTWGWEDKEKKPIIKQTGPLTIKSSHHTLGDRHVAFSPSPSFNENEEDIQPRMLFTENNTNNELLYGTKNNVPYVKDAFHRYIIDEEKEAVNPDNEGTKFAAWYAFDEDDGVPPGECAVIRFRFSRKSEDYVNEEELDNVIEQRRIEADDFYYRINPLPMAEDLRNIQRQALAGMLWTKQYYHFIWDQWANGDPAMIPPPPGRKNVRNQRWKHMYLDDILSMPDSWEYPFFAAWDTAFHCIPLAMVDPDFAKRQLDLLTREWYMHPNGQLPAYEWNFGDVNPPVHAWAVFRTFKIERKMYGRQDLDFLERVFQKLLLNFTWWVNRKDADGKNVFEGGFLGLDNIGLFNRSEPLPTGGVLEQADSTGWMAFYCLNMLNIALELAKHRRTYEDIASKFFEHFILISDAMTFRNQDGETSLWNEEDSFYYDAISYGGPWTQQLPVRSLVGLIPLYAASTLEPELINAFPSFKRRLNWFIENKNDVAERNIASMRHRGKGDRMLLALVSKDRLEKILRRMLDETEFLSDHGIRSLSKYHEKNPFSMDVNGQKFTVGYVPGDSDSGLFGGNSNWRGPIWICVNFLLIESLLRFYMFYGDSFKIECPTGSGDYMHLGHVAEELQHRLQHLYVRDYDGRRAINNCNDLLDFDEHWRDYLWFYEFFDADTGRGLGASHQCGWTGLLAKIIHDTGLNCRLPQTPRTPTSTAAHFFDDVFHRSAKPQRPGQRWLRRSSTSRSIGNRSDFESVINGDAGGIPNEEEAVSTNGAPTNGVGHVEDHFSTYVADQLGRVRNRASLAAYEDEFHTQIDANGTNGH